MKKLSPAKRRRVEFFSITTAVFFSAAILMGLLFSAITYYAYEFTEFAGNTQAVENAMPSNVVGVVAGLVYGLIISMMVGSIMIFVRFMSDKPLWFKILAAVLWLITYICIGFIMYAVIPYWVYNTVKMFMREKEPEVIWSADNYNSLTGQSAAQPAIAQSAAGTDAVALPVNEVEAVPADENIFVVKDSAENEATPDTETEVVPEVEA